MPRLHLERHRFLRVGWLRAAVLGADDGIVSTASILIGVAAAAATGASASTTRSAILVAGLASLVGGALSMAAGEYVSVSSQRDTERADIAREQRELARSPDLELDELTNIYVERGLEKTLAREVATQLTAADPLGAHMRDELGMHVGSHARPLQAALVSATSFAIGSIPPWVAAAAFSSNRIPIIAGVGLVLLAVTGGIGGRLGGAPPLRAASRVLAGGGLAMGVSALIGNLVGTAI
ncbi:MAG: VIT family protein [Acidimicrobiia bacterium]|nr:VIT family protein [Acidimicrobiia bacterium]